MKKSLFIKMIILAAINLAVAINVSGQSKYQSSAFEIKLTGTSNLHDWEMKAISGTSDASFVVEKDKVISVSKLNFSLPAKNLKSGHNAMDKNTYKALKTDSNPTISFVLVSATVISSGGNNYKLNCVGKMTIAGVTNQTDLAASGIYNPANKTFTITGIKKMKMTDYNVTPPKALLGTLKTGNDISIAYNIKFSS
ncbi:MAG: YceI family protein [Ferruginibacter sp.]